MFVLSKEQEWLPMQFFAFLMASLCVFIKTHWKKLHSQLHILLQLATNMLGTPIFGLSPDPNFSRKAQKHQACRDATSIFWLTSHDWTLFYHQSRDWHRFFVFLQIKNHFVMEGTTSFGGLHPPAGIIFFRSFVQGENGNLRFNTKAFFSLNLYWFWDTNAINIMP